jgi:hypothetical protein
MLKLTVKISYKAPFLTDNGPACTDHLKKPGPTTDS